MVKRMRSAARYPSDMTPRTDASLLTRPALFVFCSSSGCQTSSWKALGSWLKNEFGHDHLHEEKVPKAAQKHPQLDSLSLTLVFKKKQVQLRNSAAEHQF